MQELQRHTPILKKGACQGDPVSAYHFILCLKVLFLLKAYHKIQGMNIFPYHYLYTAYADDATFFFEK